MSGGRVYVISANGTAVKVGRARDVEARRMSLQIGSLVPLRVCYATDEVAEASTVEALAHDMLQHKRIFGEWFSATEQEAIAAVSEALRRSSDGTIKFRFATITYYSDDREKLNELRKVMDTPEGKIPSESAIWREALGHLHEAMVKKGKRK